MLNGVPLKYRYAIEHLTTERKNKMAVNVVIDYKNGIKGHTINHSIEQYGFSMARMLAKKKEIEKVEVVRVGNSREYYG
jgi:hypothetical protein